MWILLLNRQPRSCVCFFHFTIITLIPNVVVVVIVASAECVCKVKWQNTYFCSKDEQDETMWKSRVRKKWFTQENCYKKTLFEPENNTSRPKRQEEFEKNRWILHLPIKQFQVPRLEQNQFIEKIFLFSTPQINQWPEKKNDKKWKEIKM